MQSVKFLTVAQILSVNKLISALNINRDKFHKNCSQLAANEYDMTVGVMVKIRRLVDCNRVFDYMLVTKMFCWSENV